MHQPVHNTRERPKNLDLLSVRFPMSAIMSIGHRAAGIVLFFSLPYCLYLLQLSLSNEAGFAQASQALNDPWLKILALTLIWSLAHHLFAGIRYFFLDLDIGIKKAQAQKSAIIVMVSGFLVFLVSAILLI